MVTSRSKAENGRSNGGVMNIVTKSGTNAPARQLLHVVPRRRDEREDDDREDQQQREAGLPPLSVRRQLRRPDRRRTRLHYFGAVERTQQDTFQMVNTRGPVPESRRHLRDAVSRDPVQRQGDRQHHRRRSTCRCATAATRTRSRTARRRTRRRAAGATATNDFNSVNLNHNWVLGGNKLNEFIFQYADFRNHIAAQQPRSLRAVPQRRGRRPEPEHAADAPSRRSGSSATTSPGTSPAWAASATTSRPA